jgi:hypothetical protein
MNVFVRNYDLGFFTQEPITVQKFEIEDDEPVVSWCNHAGAESETVENQIDRIDEPDICWTSTIMVCDKCGAYKLEGESWWQDAPFEGISYE